VPTGEISGTKGHKGTSWDIRITSRPQRAQGAHLDHDALNGTDAANAPVAPGAHGPLWPHPAQWRLRAAWSAVAQWSTGPTREQIGIRFVT